MVWKESDYEKFSYIQQIDLGCGNGSVLQMDVGVF